MPILLDAPLRDSDGDGRIVLSDATAKKLSQPLGTVLIYEGPEGAKHRYRAEGEAVFQAAARLPALSAIAGAAPAALTLKASRFLIAGKGSNYLPNAAPTMVRGLPAAYKSREGEALPETVIRDHDLEDVGVLYRGKSASHVTIQRVCSRAARYAAGTGRGILMLEGAANDILVEDTTFQSDAPITSPGDVYGAINLLGKLEQHVGARFVFRRFHFSGFRTKYPGTGFANSDAISVEKGYTDGLIEDGLIEDTDDAGVDLKGPRWRLHNLITRRCHKSLKLWIGGEDGVIQSEHPTGMHVMMVISGGGERSVDFLRPISDNPKIPLVQFERAGNVYRVKDWDPSGIDLTQRVLAKAVGIPKNTCKLILPDREILV